MSASLHSRARKIHERRLILAWEYRQRHHSKGMWFRLRRVLVNAGEAWVIDARDADRLEALSHVPLPVGRELSPQKRLIVVTPEHLEALASRQRIPVNLGLEFLAAENVALVPFRPEPA